jgi:hypothetical protein
MVARAKPGIEAAGPYERLCHGTGEATEPGLTGRHKWSPHEAERRDGSVVADGLVVALNGL